MEGSKIGRRGIRKGVERSGGKKREESWIGVREERGGG